ncbi:MAG TPA: hypothetical protein VIS49_07845 [Cyclobacteriaceae bacterium]
MTKSVVYIAISLFLGISVSCTKSKHQDRTSFTKADSVSESYLNLEDSLLHAWNVMARDERDKIKAMHEILHMMQEQKEFEIERLKALGQRLKQLDKIKFTQKSLANSYVIEEYDFASNSLVSEILSLAESNDELIKNDKAQRLIDKVKFAEQRVNDYREAYDRIASRYNQFIERNEKYLTELDHQGEKKALFQMASE